MKARHLRPERYRGYQLRNADIAALVASAGLMWGTAHATPDTSEALPEETSVVVLELPPIPGVEPGSAEEQAILGLLVQQLIEAMQAQGEGNVEVEFVPPVQAQGI